MSVKKIVISPNNTKALEFFEDLNRRKEEMYRKIEDSPVVKRMASVIVKKTVR
jgi:hypothetical protein